ncbi:unnamed protein product [Rotaria sp. Silwood2]|nr:unnamed protein product [Rotaria sp. Silwood2]CAF4031658.1 unnamed protein product [Rotaria sp. Silwood2]
MDNSVIREVFHEQLSNDDEEQQIWCIVQYFNQFQIFDSILYVVHFTILYSMNFLYTLIIIVTTTGAHSKAYHQQIYENHLRQQTLNYYLD